MAPALIETPQLPVRSASKVVASGGLADYKEAFSSGPKVFNSEAETKGTAKQPPAKYPNYLPVWDLEKNRPRYEPLQPFTHKEHGKDADPTFPNLLQNAKVSELTSNIGAEVEGVQLSKLSDKGKDELALFVAQKKVVAFRNQDFADLPIQDALNYGGYFGRHHIHPTSGAPKGFPEVHLVHRGAEDTTARDFFETRTNSVAWHSDVTYEEQPPGTTFLYLLDGPVAGGDTLFVNQAEAYRRLSPEFQRRLHGLKAVHSGHEQADNSRGRGGAVRREPVANIHPIVRTHPVTGEKALFVNAQFTRKIIGYKKEESDYLLNFLFDHIAKGQDFQARVKWAPGTVVVWDNRVTAHSALLDWDDGQRRHLARITPQAERPEETPFESK
ncbi:alpha-ketoglutarate-dependent taurine dioxygenase [Mytilinidion resinicola]|uniref:Alpha-ketoglutarate-dependent taurine dioxygenase n=1 Tax=Mytilinidion resinicola TaxID=574789 RepID=A0A6A6YIT9_9PEZI|nr:alpha-ketoglutarate-dependent taurine dioxygenase [Mytilinidion resinicola]KAF2808772.1 alpha-ketoglutarate-dependent taurine dioxygenase [Mytilinidion resinicola]